MQVSPKFTVLLGIAAVALTTTTVVIAGQGTQKTAGKAVVARKTTPPLPNVGFAPVRPMDVVRATYDFAAQHPEILKYVPCYCGCGSQGHMANEACFISRRDARGNVLEWDTHGFGCTICIDVAREAMPKQ
jgi:hypothetical protein